jgi:hypothetical protein
LSYVTEPSKLSLAAIREYAERVGEHYKIYDRTGEAKAPAIYATYPAADSESAAEIAGSAV